MACEVRLVNRGEVPPVLIVIHYGDGTERRINPNEDVYLLVTPQEGCGRGSLGELESLLEYATHVVVSAHKPKEVKSEH